MSLTYTTYVTRLSSLTGFASDDENFEAILPSVIEYAEGRIVRELDMMVANVRDTVTLSAGTRHFTLPTNVGQFQVVDGVNVITPADTLPDSGTRRPLTPVSRAVLDMIYPSSSGAGVPQMFAYVSQTSVAQQPHILLGPWPDAAYRAEVVGSVMPAALSSGNATTFISTYLPDLLVAASMVFLTGWMKNFGAQSDDPKMGVSWNEQYKTLMGSAATWEARKRFAGASWSSRQPEPTAVPQRG